VLQNARNVDHFFFLDVDELEATTPLRLQSQAQGLADRVHAMGRIADTNLQQELHKDFNDMPKLSKIKMEDYAVVHVSPSVIPTYLPGIRVFRWAICHLYEVGLAAQISPHAATTSRVSNWMTTTTRVVSMV
jgi:endopolyphosphatase